MINRAVKMRQGIAASVRPIAGGCTKDTARCADARDYNSELRDCCKAHIRLVVEHAAEILTAMQVVWWADYGTLLGAVRNPLTTWADYPWLRQTDRTTTGPASGIIPHDKDADFGILVENEAAAYHIFARICSKVQRAFGHHATVRGMGRSMKIRLSFSNHSSADFFAWWAPRPNGILSRKKYINIDRYKGRDFHRDTLFPLSTVEWEGLTLPAPRDPVAFAAFRYGDTWMTPVRANNDGKRRGTGYFA